MKTINIITCSIDQAMTIDFFVKWFNLNLEIDDTRKFDVEVRFYSYQLKECVGLWLEY